MGRSELRIRWRPDPFWAVLLILPVFVLIPDDSVNYSLRGFIDPWLYFGYFTHLTEFKFLFPDTYYGSRLTWLLPGAAIHRLIPSHLAANCVLHLTVYYTCLFSLYYSLKRMFGRTNAIIPSIFFGLYPYLWRAVGWDYPNGAGIAYFLLTTALLARAIPQARPRWSLAWAGAACAAMFYTNISWFAFMPFFPVYYLGLRYTSAKKPGWAATRDFILWFAAGGLAITLLLCGINYLLDGEFLFYLPSIQFAGQNRVKLTPARPDWLAWMKTTRWLIAEGAASLLAVLFLIRYAVRSKTPEDRAAAFLSAIFLCAMGFLVDSNTGQYFLHLSYYGAFFLPLTFLTIGGYMRIPQHWSSRRSAVLIAAAAAIMAMPWLRIGHEFVRPFLALGSTGSLLAAFGALVTMMVWRGRAVAVAGGIAGMFGLIACAIGFDGLPEPGAARDAFVRMTRSMDVIDQVRKEQQVGIWYDDQDPNRYEFTSLSFIYIFSGMGQKFPATDASLTPGTIVVVPSTRQDTGAIAESSFHRDAQMLRPLSVVPISTGRVRYSLFFFEVAIDPRVSEPVALSSLASGGCCQIRGVAGSDRVQRFPLREWRLISTAEDPSDMEDHSGKLRIRTPKNREAYVAAYPGLAVQESGSYRFILRYRLIAGEITFGARNSDGTLLWSPARPAEKQGRFQMKKLIIPVKKGDTLQLLIANGRDTEGASRFEIEDLTAFRDRP